MPTVREVKASRDYPDMGIVRGDTVYRWRTRNGRDGQEHVSKTFPRSSELTESHYKKPMYQITEAIEDYDGANPPPAEMIEWVKKQILEVRAVQEERLNRIPKEMHGGPVPTVMIMRMDYCDDVIRELDKLGEPTVDDVRDIALRVR